MKIEGIETQKEKRDASDGGRKKRETESETKEERRERWRRYPHSSKLHDTPILRLLLSRRNQYGAVEPNSDL